MQSYKRYFIEGDALLVHPLAPTGTLAAVCSCQGALPQSFK